MRWRAPGRSPATPCAPAPAPRAAIDDATAIHDVFDALEAGLALAQLDGDRGTLAELAAEARRRGFVRVARPATGALRP